MHLDYSRIAYLSCVVIFGQIDLKQLILYLVDRELVDWESTELDLADLIHN